jgi:TonB family protein
MYNNINDRNKSQIITFNKFIYPIVLLISVAFFTLFILGAIPSYGTETTANTSEEKIDRDSNLPDISEFIPVDSEPVVTYRHPTEYPKIAENAGITGAVYVKALVNKKGEVLKSEIYKSSGYIWLDDAAQESTSQNKYKPAIYKEKPVLYWVTHKVDFVLE